MFGLVVVHKKLPDNEYTLFVNCGVLICVITLLTLNHAAFVSLKKKFKEYTPTKAGYKL